MRETFVLGGCTDGSIVKVKSETVFTLTDRTELELSWCSVLVFCAIVARHVLGYGLMAAC